MWRLNSFENVISDLRNEQATVEKKQANGKNSDTLFSCSHLSTLQVQVELNYVILILILISFYYYFILNMKCQQL